MDLIFETEVVTLAVVSDDARFPVRRVYCVGRNYVEHIREMKEGDERDPPFFFQKPRDAVVTDDAVVPYPPMTDDFQFEGELVVAIGKPARNVSVQQAADVIFGYAAGVDLTRRDRQSEAFKEGKPWEIGKSFDASAACSAITPVARSGHLLEGAITLSVNGQQRQQVDLEQMIWDPFEIVSKLSAQYTLMPGDIIMTGTPAGVGAVVPGDQITVNIQGLAPFSISIGPAKESD